MLKDYKVYFVKFSDETFKYIAAVNMEHALLTAELFISIEYPEESEPDVVTIILESHISPLLIFKSE